MIIYLLVFLLSVFFIHISEKINHKSKSKILKIIFISLGILIPSILAGVRDYKVGTDVRVYGNIWFNNALNFIDPTLYIKWATSSSIGYLYACFNFWVSRFTNNPHYFYFWYSLVENIIMYLTLRKNKDLIDLEKGWLTYLAIFYNVTLNILRNSMSLIILLWGFYYIRKKKLVKYVLTVIIATLFHSTAIIGVIFYPMYYLVNGKLNKFGKFVSIFLILLFVICFDFIGKSLGNSNLINGRYTVEYLNTSNAVGGGFLVHLIVMSLPIFILYVANTNKVNSNFLKEYNFFKLIVTISVIMSILNRVNTYLSRITWYFDIYYILAIPFIFVKGAEWKLSNKSMSNVLFYIYLITYWIIIFGIQKSGETVPFIFMQS